MTPVRGGRYAPTTIWCPCLLFSYLTLSLGKKCMLGMEWFTQTVYSRYFDTTLSFLILHCICSLYGCTQTWIIRCTIALMFLLNSFWLCPLPRIYYLTWIKVRRSTMQLNLKSAQGKLIRKLLLASKVGVGLFFLIRSGITFVCCLKTD